jgi:PAS domain S-box-containing protein
VKRGAEETEAGLGRNGHDSEGAYRSSLSAADVTALAELVSDGIIVIDGEWRFQYLNEPAAQMLSRTVDDLLGKDMWSEFSDEAGINFRVAYERALRSGRPGRLVDYYEPLQRWFEARFFPRDDGLMILLRDVSEQHRVEQELREYGDQMAEAERIVRFGVWKWTLATERVAWSDELHRIYGLEPGQFGGTAEDFIARVRPEDRDRVRAAIERSIEAREPFAFNERIVRPDGEERVLLSQGRPIVAADGEIAALVGVCHDVTDRTAIERALGASERRIHAIIDQTPAIITVKNLDGRYVMVNAEAGRVFGVSPGDLIGQRCTDVFPADIAESQHANDQLAAAEGEAVYGQATLQRDGEPRTYLTVTFPLPDDAGLPAEICTIATDVHHSRERLAERLERISWSERINQALAEDRMLAFEQPIVHMRTGEQVSRELLARMVTAGDRQQVLEPSTFLPAAERFGLIQRIDTWMVGEAIERARDGALPVNHSAVTLSDPSSRREIIDMLAGAPGPPTRNTCDITETADVEQLHAARLFAADVVALGCHLALDDFGTGFGSFTYLSHLPLSYLKIDRSYVQALAEQPDDQRLVRGIIGVGGLFGLQTIAEGVNDERTAAVLRELGADFAQGHHFGKAAPAGSSRA